MSKLFTNEEIQTIKIEYPNTNTKLIAEKLKRPISSVYGFANRNGLKKSEKFLKEMNRENILKVGVGTRFKKGIIPANKGKKQIEYMSPEAIEKSLHTRFKKGHLPQNAKHDGYERLSKDGYVLVRVAQGKFALKHRVIWEQNFGKIPKKHVLVFKDGNKKNIHIDNLEVISFKENMLRNTIQRFPEEVKTNIKLLSKLKKTIKNHEQRKST